MLPIIVFSVAIILSDAFILNTESRLPSGGLIKPDYTKRWVLYLTYDLSQKYIAKQVII